MHVDNPDRVIGWFASYPEVERARTPVGPCTHTCEHRQTSTVGYGPDLDHYELVVCEDACAGDCRAWLATDDNAHGGTGGPTYRHAVFHPDMRQLGPVGG